MGLVHPNWEREIRRRGAEPADVIDCFHEYICAYQQEVTARDGAPDSSLLDVVFLEAEPEDSQVIELAGRLFRVKATRIPDDEAEILRLRSIRDAETQDEDLRRGTDPLLRLMKLAGLSRRNR